MAFVLNVIAQINGGQGTGDIDRLEQKLDDTTQAAGRATTALKGMGEGAAQGMDKASDALEKYRQELDAKWAAINQTKFDDQNLKRINAPMEEFKAQLASIDRLLVADKLSMEQYDAELVKLNDQLNKSQPKLSDELLREQQILEKINGPMREYQAQVAALDGLLKKSEIDLETYNRELDKAAKSAGKGLGPAQGPQQQAAGGAGSGGDAWSTSSLQSVIGGAGMLLAGGAAAGVVALGEKIEGLIGQYREIQDVAITATNAVQRFTDANHSATVVIDQQMALAAQLHSTYSQTVGLYGRLAESADALSLSQSEITTLTKEFGEAVQVAGKPLDAADGIMRRFAYGMAAGKIETREMRSIMREIPPIADLWTKAFGATRAELIQMVKDGRVSTEDLMGALLKGSDAIQAKFEKLAETHAKTKERWMEDEKILSQRYDVGMGAGHVAQSTVDWLKQDQETRYAILKGGGPFSEMAKAAQQQIEDETKAALANTIDDLKNLTGAFRPIGDLYRKWAGDTAAVRAEVLKLNEPVAAAKTELETLNKAFSTGQVDVDTYNKRYNELLTTINHGIGSQAYKILDPIRIAKAELAALNNELAAGANITEAQWRKASTQLQTTIHGFTPEDLKLNNPKLDARDQLADLVRAQKEGTITGEAFRKEYDALITTINDGRLPEAIKIWEGIHLPIEQATRDFAALSALWRQGRVDVKQYTDEINKIAGTKLNGEATLLTNAIAVLDKRLAEGQLAWSAHNDVVRKVIDSYAELHRTASGIAYRMAPNVHESQPDAPTMPARGLLDRDADIRKAFENQLVHSTTLVPGAANLWNDTARQSNDQLERANKLADEFVAPSVKYEQRLKDIGGALELNSITEDQATAARRRARDTLNSETEALEAQKGPMEAYAAAQRKLKDQLDAGDISQRKYTEGLDKAKETMLQATGAAETFSGAMQINWIKMKQDAEGFGATVANLAVADFGKLNDAIVTAANGGAVSWGQMADAMIQDLERVALKMAEIGLIKGAIGLFSGLGGGGGGLADTGNFGAEFGAGNYGFATGGSFLVGGDGGTDTTHVGFRATRGERVTITPPGAYPYPQAPSGGAAMAGGAAVAPVVEIHNHYDSSVTQAAMDGPGGQKSVINTLRLNPGAARNMTSRPRRA